MGRPAPTKNGHDFFVVSSMLQKSLRRGDIALAAKACNELLPKYENYIWNRLLIVSAEDCASLVTQEIVGLYQAWQKVISNRDKATQPLKGQIFYAKAIVLLAKSVHSRDADELLCLVSARMPDDVFEAALREVAEIWRVDDGDFEIPEWVYDVHTRQGKRAGATKEDFFRDEHAVMDTTLFDNFEVMNETWGYVEPEVSYPAKPIEGGGE